MACFMFIYVNEHTLVGCLNLLILSQGTDCHAPPTDAYGHSTCGTRPADQHFRSVYISCYVLIVSTAMCGVCVCVVSFYTHAHRNYARHRPRIRFSFFVSGSNSFACEQMDYRDKRSGFNLWWLLYHAGPRLVATPCPKPPLGCCHVLGIV